MLDRLFSLSKSFFLCLFLLQGIFIKDFIIAAQEVDDESCFVDGSGRGAGSLSSSLVEKCRSVGFDPWNLSCETCNIIYAHVDDNDSNELDYIKDISPSCFDCCQSYKGSTKFLTKPYESALIVQTTLGDGMSGSMFGGGDRNSELTDFFKDDYDTILKNKSKKRILHVQKKYDPSKRYTDGTVRYTMFGVRPTTILFFFDKIQKEFASQPSSLPHDVETYIKKAKEVIYLDDGWKRDDIRDMINTLLPGE